MCVNHLTMVPAVVNFVTSKGKDTYTGFISDLICVKCATLSVSLKIQTLLENCVNQSLESSFP